MSKKSTVVPAVPDQTGVRVQYIHTSKMGHALIPGNEYIVLKHLVEKRSFFDETEYFLIRAENGKEFFVEESCFIYNKVYR